MRNFIVVLLLFCHAELLAQTNDTLKVRVLKEVNVSSIRQVSDMLRLDSIRGTFIYSGKKNEVIDLTARDVALTEKYGRQIFAKIPGVFVYDMDGTGNQVNISTRGLDPHRGWEFNIRKDGIITNSDMYGYPASHYNIPMEAVERIELVRGTGSLQYGAQFGGMLNYVSKTPDPEHRFLFESINTAGSHGLLSTFNSVSGTSGKFRYFAWFNKKSIQGYRKDSDSQFDAQNISLIFAPAENVQITAGWTRSNYVTHLPGPLTDEMFYTNPRSATRERNYYNPDIRIPSLRVKWDAGSQTTLELSTSGVFGERNSVMFDKPATTPDAIDPITMQYASRQVDIDNFRSYTTELRLLQGYRMFSRGNHVSAGVQYMNNDLHRRQQGTGTTGSDFDLTLVTPAWGRDMHFKTGNLALFVENSFSLTDALAINAGARAELGETDMSGRISNYPLSDIPNIIRHRFPLFGINAQYKLNNTKQFYAGWSQGYRPVIFKDIIPASVYEVADKNLKDAEGYNLEAGFRGRWKWFSWDASYFQLVYKNRLGTLAQLNQAGEEVIFRTNIGNSVTHGMELFAQGDFDLNSRVNLTLFTATAFMDAVYRDAMLRSGNTNISVAGNIVESVPRWQSRNGLTLKTRLISLSALYSYTGESFADAFNSTTPTATGSAGLVPAYGVVDFNTKTRLGKNLDLSLNLNNAFNQSYFTKRPQFYPGPGIWPSDGRTLSATLAFSFY